MKTLFVYESVNVDVCVHYFLTNRICKIAFIYDIFFFYLQKKKFFVFMQGTKKTFSVFMQHTKKKTKHSNH